jgi:hypothetical protein
LHDDVTGKVVISTEGLVLVLKPEDMVNDTGEGKT